MRRSPRVSGAEVVQALERMGFRQVRQRGSHVVMRKDTPDGAIGCVVPLHRELATGTLNGILDQARIRMDELLDNL